MESHPRRALFFFGDSIANGQGVPALSSWPVMSALSLEPGGLDVFISAVNGETSRGGLERFDRHFNALPRTPDYLFVQYGINDANYWESSLGFPRVSLTSFCANISEFIDRALGAGVQKVLIGTNHPVRKSLPSEAEARGIHDLWESVAKYNESIRGLGNPSQSRHVIDFETIFTGDSHLMTDGVHLTPAGHRSQSEFFVQSLRALGLVS